MHRYYCRQPCRNRSQRLPNGNIGLIDAHYLALLFGFVMIGNYSVKHGVAQAVKQTVNKYADGKRY